MFSSISYRLTRIRTKQITAISKYHSIIKNIDFKNSFSIKSNINNNYLISSNVIQLRHLFKFPFKPPLTSSKTRKYRERRVLGYSKEQLFEVVSDIEDYHLFIPACVKSRVIERNESYIRADLEIGIPPLIWEKYTSRVTLKRPTLVSAKCIDGKLFKHLDTEWKFSDGFNKNSCVLDFNLSFEFKSYLHSHLVHVFFDQMAKQTVNAFLRRAETLYGKQSSIVSQLPDKSL